MLLSPENFYCLWRVRCGVVPLLREDDDSPPERLLQSIWQQQRLLRDQLKTLDGQIVRVLHPGFRSVEGGPDFRGAVIQIGDGPPRVGDVEVDLRPAGWRAHGHDTNPAFRNVILHVVWDSDKGSNGSLPLLKLREALDAPLGQLSLWLGNEHAFGLPDELRGKCCAPLCHLTAEQLHALFRQSAMARLQSKAASFQVRARQVGWEQPLWEGLFRALGYKHNVWPMQRLGELRPRWSSGSSEPITTEARLFGISGLLPPDLTRSQTRADNYVRQVWDQWWRERDEFSDCVLPRTLWRFHGLRPANHPQRRLALASRWSLDGNISSKLEHWCAAEIADSALPSSLLEVLQVEPNEFWARHCTFHSRPLKRPQPLIGATRVTDLAVNVVLPWLWIRAAEGKNEALKERIEHRYFAWPPAEDNSLLRQARQRLLGGAHRRILVSAAVQQGLIQIIRDFCEQSNALCQNCKFPELVKEWTETGEKASVV